MTPPAPNRVLRTWREAHGLSRPQMADALNQTPTAGQYPFWCDPSLIYKWETGHIRWPSVRYQAALHDLTGHTPAELGFTQPTPATHSPPPLPGGPSAGQLSQADATLIDNLTTLAGEFGCAWACWPSLAGIWYAVEIEPWCSARHLNLITATSADGLYDLLRTTGTTPAHHPPEQAPHG